MNFIKKLFSEVSSKSETKESFPWKPLVAIDQLDVIAESSHKKTIVIFKHSTRCFISRKVLSNFEKEASEFALKADPYFLDLLQFRSVSNAVAERYNVIHQSPQL